MSRQIGNVQSLALNFFVILPSWVFQPSFCVSSLLRIHNCKCLLCFFNVFCVLLCSKANGKCGLFLALQDPKRAKRKRYCEQLILWQFRLGCQQMSMLLDFRFHTRIQLECEHKYIPSLAQWPNFVFSHSTVSLRFMNLQVAWNKLGTDYKKKPRTKTQKGVAQYKS